jgi:hypothetical protein
VAFFCCWLRWVVLVALLLVCGGVLPYTVHGWIVAMCVVLVLCVALRILCCVLTLLYFKILSGTFLRLYSAGISFDSAASCATIKRVPKLAARYKTCPQRVTKLGRLCTATFDLAANAACSKTPSTLQNLAAACYKTRAFVHNQFGLGGKYNNLLLLW